MVHRSGVGSDDNVVPLAGAVLCVQTITDHREDLPPCVVRLVVTAVSAGAQVTVTVEAWEPD